MVSADTLGVEWTFYCFPWLTFSHFTFLAFIYFTCPWPLAVQNLALGWTLTWLPFLVFTLCHSINVKNSLTFNPCLCFLNPSFSSSAQLPKEYSSLKTEWQERECGGVGLRTRTGYSPGGLVSLGRSAPRVTLPAKLFTKPNVVKERSMKVKSPSHRIRKDLAGLAKTNISVGGGNVPNIQFKEAGGSGKIRTKLFSFQKSSLQTRRENKSCLRVVVIYRLWLPQNC